MVQPFRMNPVYDRLIRGDDRTPVGLYQLQLATARQLCRLHYSPGSYTRVQTHLKALVDHGIIRVDAVPTTKGNGYYYYTLAARGLSYMQEVGYLTRDEYRVSRVVGRELLFLSHTLELNDLLIAAALVGREGTPYSLAGFTHERLLKRKPYRAKWQHQTYTLIPDALLDFRYAGQQTFSMPVLLEHDRGTEGRDHFQRRIRAYIALLHDEAARVELFDTAALSAVAFTTFKGDKRVEQMRRWTAQELKGVNPSLGETFRFISLTQPVSPRLWLEPSWLDPYDDPPHQLIAA